MRFTRLIISRKLSGRFRFHSLLKPLPPFAIRDVHEFDANRAAIEFARRIRVRTGQIQLRRSRLLALSPASTLRRGYAIVQHRDDGVVRGAAEVKPGEILTVRFAEDQLTVRVPETRPANDGGDG